MLGVPWSTFTDAFRLEPQKKLSSVGMQQIADRLETLRIEVFLYLPVAHIVPPRPVTEPLGVNPVVVEGQIVRDNLPDIFQMTCGRRGSPIVVRNRRPQRLSIHHRPVVRQDELPQKVVPTHRLSLPEEHQDSRRANLLAGVKF